MPAVSGVARILVRGGLIFCPGSAFAGGLGGGSPPDGDKFLKKFHEDVLKISKIQENFDIFLYTMRLFFAVLGQKIRFLRKF